MGDFKGEFYLVFQKKRAFQLRNALFPIYSKSFKIFYPNFIVSGFQRTGFAL